VLFRSGREFEPLSIFAIFDIKKSCKNQPLQISAFCLKNIEDTYDTYHITILTTFTIFLEFGFENAKKIFCRKSAIMEAKFLGFWNCDFDANAHSCRQLPCLTPCQLASKSQFSCRKLREKSLDLNFFDVFNMGNDRHLPRR